MGATRKYRDMCADFETTVYDGQTSTEVWAAACCDIGSYDGMVFRSLDDMLDHFLHLKQNLHVYFHNLKFDGSFILSWLLRSTDYVCAIEKYGESENDVKFMEPWTMPPCSFTYKISSRGQWYSLILHTKYKKFIEFRDSLKLLPFSIKDIGTAFNTKYKKLSIKYEGERHAGQIIPKNEEEYILNDIRVPSEALRTMFDQGHTELTIGSCCLREFKSEYDEDLYKSLFPNLDDIELDNDIFGSKNVGDYVRMAYRGGWCYYVPEKTNRLLGRGVTLDVNSLYPSMMHSCSGNRYPYGLPQFWTGNYIPDDAMADNVYYFVRIRTRFNLKPGKLPFVSMKGNLMYNQHESLITSDIKDKQGFYHETYIDLDGTEKPAACTITFCMNEYNLFLEYYDVYDFEILDGCVFNAYTGFFDKYIDKYMALKMTATGALRTLAKLFLNNLYGKFATNRDASFKIAYLKPDGELGYKIYPGTGKTPGYIPIGAAITAYSREFTIRAAQKNYRGSNLPGFCYADTDSIHCDCDLDVITGVNIDSKKLCCWKHESTWDSALFVRLKTYMEHIIPEDKTKSPYWDIKCAGMPDVCKQHFLQSVMYGKPDPEKLKNGEYSPEELEFVSTKRQITDFKIGLEIPGKLRQKNIPGGIILEKTTFKLRAA